MNPKQTVEQAFEAYLEDQDDVGIPVYKGVENTTLVDESGQQQRRERPCVTVSVEGDLTEAIPLTGDWQGIVTVSVEADSQNLTDEEFYDLCRTVFAHFNTSDLAVNLTDAREDFTSLFACVESISNRFTDGNNWINSIRVYVVFCESDL